MRLRNIKYYSFFSLMLFTLLFHVKAFAQEKELSLNKIKKKANLYFIEENYMRAFPLYQKLDSIVPNNANYEYKLGVCFLFAGNDKYKALQIIEKIKDTEIANNEIDFYYCLGRSYHLNYRFGDAKVSYHKYLSLNRKLITKQRIIDVRRLIEMCDNGEYLIQDSISAPIENIGKTVNSQYPDYAPVISADEELLIFTSRRSGSIGGLRNIHGQKDPHGKYFEDIYITKKEDEGWGQPINIGEVINTKGHDANIGLSADARQLFIYRNDKKIYGDIYVSTLEKDNWSEPTRLDKPINTKKYWEGSTSLSTDGKELYFTSNRPGGMGGRDIYKSVLLSDGVWSDPQNLGDKVNTKYDEDAPYFHADSRTIYFSSKGHSSIGGYDIFKSVLKNNVWNDAENLGYPINTPYDDIYFVLSSDRKSGYFSTDRAGGYGSYDIYKVFLPALISGMNVSGGRDPSLIPRLNGKVAVVKDFTKLAE